MLSNELRFVCLEEELARKTYQSLYELDADEMKKRLLQNMYAMSLMTGRLDKIMPRDDLPDDFYLKAYKTLVEDGWILQGLLREVECNPNYIGRVTEELRDYEFYLKMYENLKR